MKPLKLSFLTDVPPSSARRKPPGSATRSPGRGTPTPSKTFSFFPKSMSTGRAWGRAPSAYKLGQHVPCQRKRQKFKKCTFGGREDVIPPSQTPAGNLYYSHSSLSPPLPHFPSPPSSPMPRAPRQGLNAPSDPSLGPGMHKEGQLGMVKRWSPLDGELPYSCWRTSALASVGRPEVKKEHGWGVAPALPEFGKDAPKVSIPSTGRKGFLIEPSWSLFDAKLEDSYSKKKQGGGKEDQGREGKRGSISMMKAKAKVLAESLASSLTVDTLVASLELQRKAIEQEGADPCFMKSSFGLARRFREVDPSDSYTQIPCWYPSLYDESTYLERYPCATIGKERRKTTLAL